MIKGSLRSLLLSTAISAGLAASAGGAQALEFRFGELQMTFETTISAGAALRTQSRDHSFLPGINGGPVQDVSGLIVIPSFVATTDGDVGGNSGVTMNQNPLNPALAAATTIAGSINTDDGRLNFDRGDLTSGVIKMTNDVTARFQNYRFFGRLSSYYDAVLSDRGSYERRGLHDGQADAARDVRVLDLYAAANYDIGTLPFQIRAGKQVISWGEGTFIQNGINTVNPVDVAAVRRPASELKEFFIPVWAVDASIGLPYDLSLEAFYQLKWDTFDLDRSGTPFASSDVAAIAGNGGNFSFLTAAPGGNLLRNCDGTNVVSNTFTSAWLASTNPLAQYRDCTSANALSFRDFDSSDPSSGLFFGNREAISVAAGDSSVVQRLEDDRAKNNGQFGLAARWFSPDLGNTEFGLFFTNTHSRLPLVSERVRVNPATTSFTSFSASGLNSSSTGRGLPFAGCNLAAGGGGTAAQPGALFGVPVGTSAAALAQMNQTGVDNDGILAAATVLANNFYNGTTPGTIVTNPVGSPFAALGIVGTDISAFFGQPAGTTVVQPNSVLQSTIVNCALVAMQSNRFVGSDAQMGIGPNTTNGNALLNDGAEIVFADPATPTFGLFLEYPEDVRLYGLSFNTTVGTWGVQGEVSYRDNAPVQLDTDQITIDVLNKACVFEQLLGTTAFQALIPFATGLPNPDTLGGACGDLGGNGAASQDVHGFKRTDMWTGQIGTTATFQNSNMFVNAVGADLFIFVTEVGLAYFPDAPDETGGNVANVRWGNVCANGGTDLPLGGFLSLASRSGCRPTKSSWGYVLLGQLNYFNALGTAVTLQPTVAFSHDVSGNTPAPYSNYRRGRKSINLSLNGTLTNTWRAGVSYTNFFGNSKYNDAVDRDNVAVNLSYSF